MTASDAGPAYETPTSSPSAAKRRRERMQRLKPARSPLAQAGRWLLVWVQTVLVTGLIAFLAASCILRHDVGRFRPSLFPLRLDELPPDQGLALKRRRGKRGAACASFGVENDEYFEHYGGVYCGQVVYEAPMEAPTMPVASDAVDNGALVPPQFVAPASARQLLRAEMLYKTFDSEANAREYYWRFWGMHCHDPLPMFVMTDVTATQQPVGEAPHILLWEPTQMPWPPNTVMPEAGLSKQIIYIFRAGHTFVKLTLTGQPRHFALNVNVPYAMTLASLVLDRIHAHTPHSVAAVARSASLGVLRRARRLDRLAHRAARQLWDGAVSEMELAGHVVTKAIAEEPVFGSAAQGGLPAAADPALEPFDAVANDSELLGTPEPDVQGLDDPLQARRALTSAWDLLPYAVTVLVVFGVIGASEALDTAECAASPAGKRRGRHQR